MGINRSNRIANTEHDRNIGSLYQIELKNAKRIAKSLYLFILLSLFQNYTNQPHETRHLSHRITPHTHIMYTRVDAYTIWNWNYLYSNQADRITQAIITDHDNQWDDCHSNIWIWQDAGRDIRGLPVSSVYVVQRDDPADIRGVCGKWQIDHHISPVPSHQYSQKC